MSVASKLTKSVRQAKESAESQSDAAESESMNRQPDHPSGPRPSHDNSAAAKSVQKTEKPKVSPGDRKKPEPESPVESLPYRRVWPD